MKTVLDAVIKFKGEWPFSDDFMRTPSSDNDVSEQGRLRTAKSKYTNEYWVNVCSRNEFNALVAELASNFGKCDISYQKHCSNEVTRLEGDKMKTVTHEGKVYQIGAVYEFSDDGADWRADVLLNVCNTLNNKWEVESEYFDCIRECQAAIGTITEAAVELVDGECYQFDGYTFGTCKGVYDKEKGCFWVKGVSVQVKHRTNIKPLTVEK